MRYGRVATRDGVTRDVTFMDGHAADSSGRWPQDQVRILTPVLPRKLIYVGMNYVDHAAELGVDLPEEPLLFFKPPTAIVGHGDQVVHPDECQRLDYEGELAVVIGHEVHGIDADSALDAVAGYTIANDITARDFQLPDTQWTKAKSWDTFAPLGPWIETDLDPFDARIETYVNGQLRQNSSTKNLYHSVPALIAYASRLMTLQPDDIIATGTPAGIGPMRPGDTVDVVIDGIGRLTNMIVTP